MKRHLLFMLLYFTLMIDIEGLIDFGPDKPKGKGFITISNQICNITPENNPVVILNLFQDLTQDS